MQKLNILVLILALAFAAAIVLAEEENVTSAATTTIDVSQELELDENVEPEDLGVGDPDILPDSPFYFLKNLGRSIQELLTFNSVDKAKLKEKFSSEKLLELKKMVEGNKGQEVVEKAIENYKNAIEKVNAATERIREKAQESEKVGTFLDKFIQQQTLQHKILQKLENQVGTTTFEKIEAAREEHLEKFGEVMNRLENKEQLQERVENNLQEIKGSQFKNFKNLEILKELEEKVPEQAKEAIQKAQENALKRLKGNLQNMSSENQEKFQEYLNKISGLKDVQLEILENVKSELKEMPQIKENLMQIREKIMENIEEKTEAKNCPAIEKTATGFCQQGRVVTEKNENGCVTSFKCIITGEETIEETQLESGAPKPTLACITLWNPVCGEDGKTYSNECFARSAGIEIAFEGTCEKTENKIQNQNQNINSQNNR